MMEFSLIFSETNFMQVTKICRNLQSLKERAPWYIILHAETTHSMGSHDPNVPWFIFITGIVRTGGSTLPSSLS